MIVEWCMQDGIKELERLLDSDEVLKSLDRFTMQIWPHDPVPGKCDA